MFTSQVYKLHEEGVLLAKNKKINLTEPIYEIQEKETPKQYWFANEYFHFDGTIDEFLDYWYPEDDNGHPLPIPQHPPVEKKIHLLNCQQKGQ